MFGQVTWFETIVNEISTKDKYLHTCFAKVQDHLLKLNNLPFVYGKHVWKPCLWWWWWRPLDAGSSLRFSSCNWTRFKRGRPQRPLIITNQWFTNMLWCCVLLLLLLVLLLRTGGVFRAKLTTRRHYTLLSPIHSRKKGGRRWASWIEFKSAHKYKALALSIIIGQCGGG